MSKSNFYELLDRYRSGNCTEREKQLVEQWFSLLDQEMPERDARENKDIEEKIWNAIQEQNTEENRIVFNWWKWCTAAMIILAGGWALYQFNSKPEYKTDTISGIVSDNIITKRNDANTPQTIHLPDSSLVTLYPGSAISYNAGLAGPTREIYLKGKAFFDVFRDENRPLQVHVGQVVTRVLGTSFWVEGDRNNADVEVSVMSGKVSVSKTEKAAANHDSKPEDGVILTANQRVKYSHTTNVFETGLVVNPQSVIARTKQAERENFVFQDAPFSQVVEELEKSFGINIILENEAVGNCLFTANITNEPLFTKLDLLCKSVQATYEVRGTDILINGKGCQ